MASSRPLKNAESREEEAKRGYNSSLLAPEIHTQPGYRRLALLNGLLIGLLISLIYWAPKIMSLAELPTTTPYVSVGATSFLIMLFCVLTSWLTGRIDQGVVTVLWWLGTAVFITLLLGYFPAYSQNWLTWLVEPRFQGLPVYPLPAGNAWLGFVVAGLALIFILTVLAILQGVRLERAYNELGARRQLTLRAFFILFLPALLAGLGAFLTPDHLASAPRQALAFTHQAIQVGRTYDGDLFALSRQTDFNYNAIAPVQEQLDGPYHLLVGETQFDGSIIIIVAHFANGAWVNCRVNADYAQAIYLSFCDDGSRPYTLGFRTLFTGEPLPENCFNCLPQAEAEQLAWLQTRAPRFQGDPQFERIAQQGSYVWMRATAPGGNYAVECLFHGIREVWLETCVE